MVNERCKLGGGENSRKWRENGSEGSLERKKESGGGRNAGKEAWKMTYKVGEKIRGNEDQMEMKGVRKGERRRVKVGGMLS